MIHTPLLIVSTIAALAAASLADVTIERGGIVTYTAERSAREWQPGITAEILRRE